MIEQDYLLRLLVGFFAAIQRAMERGGREGEPGEAARTLDDAVGTALDMDASMLLALSPESIAGIMQVAGVDPRVTAYAARSLQLSARYYDEAGQSDLAAVRLAQARSIAEAFGVDLADEPIAPEELLELVERDVEEARA